MSKVTGSLLAKMINRRFVSFINKHPVVYLNCVSLLPPERQSGRRSRALLTPAFAEYFATQTLCCLKVLGTLWVEAGLDITSVVVVVMDSSSVVVVVMDSSSVVVVDSSRVLHRMSMIHQLQMLKLDSVMKKSYWRSTYSDP